MWGVDRHQWQVEEKWVGCVMFFDDLSCLLKKQHFYFHRNVLVLTYFRVHVWCKPSMVVFANRLVSRKLRHFTLCIVQSYPFLLRSYPIMSLENLKLEQVIILGMKFMFFLLI